LLERTFLHIPGIGPATERRLWGSGCSDWDCLLGGLNRFSTGAADKGAIRDEILRSKDSLQRREHQYFQKALGVSEAWRAYSAFRDNCVYLDIETDGGQSASSITTIGLYDGREYHCLVKGQNLENFRDLISRYSMIVTFFGTGFDVPVLQKRFRDVAFDQIHVDLCPSLRKVGIRGGLKKIEKAFGIQRSPETDGLTGYDAVRLWRRFEVLRDDRALETLIAYNREDVVNLERLAAIACERLEREALYGPEAESPAEDFVKA
jgi:uncharacterized protein